jgi:hypothetical protein
VRAMANASLKIEAHRAEIIDRNPALAERYRT